MPHDPKIKNLPEFLKNQRSQIMEINNADNGKSQADISNPIETIIIPPLNTFSDFSSVAISPDELVSQASLITTKIPDSFNWKDNLHDLSEPDSQGSCGSCWAVATARVVNDVFLVSGLSSFNIAFSGTFLLCQNNIPLNNKCGGGNPLAALQYIQNYGFKLGTTYNWCTDNQLCSKKTSLPSINDALIDCSEKTSNLVFKISKIYSIPFNPSSSNIEPMRTMIKNHIITIGPVVSGFGVLENFMKAPKGNFQITNGIFLEDVDYVRGVYAGKKCSQRCEENFYTEDCGTDQGCLECLSCKNQNSFKKFVGGHAVGVVGWGSDNVDGKFLGKEDGKNIKIPYWIVRNSWGNKWGEGGYYKHAMYPFNYTSMLEMPHTFDGGIQMGGMVMFEPVKSIQISSTNTNSLKYIYYFVGGLIISTLFIFLLILILRKTKNM